MAIRMFRENIVQVRKEPQKTVFTLSILLYFANTDSHYENMPIHIYRKHLTPKIEKFQIKNANMFLISAQNIDCGYSLEPPRRGGSNE